MAREVVGPQPSRDELGDAHDDPPLNRVTLAARQPDPASTQQVPPGPDGRQRHLSAVWDMVLESRVVQGTLRISFPCPIVVRGGANLPAGQEPVGMFAYRLVPFPHLTPTRAHTQTHTTTHPTTHGHTDPHTRIRTNHTHTHTHKITPLNIQS